MSGRGEACRQSAAIAAPPGVSPPVEGRRAPGGSRSRAVIDPDGWPLLMKAAQDGDQQAYRTLLKEMIPLIRVRIHRRIADPVMVEDIVQDVLLTVHRVRHTYDPARPFQPWIAAIASARAVDALRRRGRTARREISDDDALGAEVDPRSNEGGEALSARSELGRLLDLLSHRQRQVAEMVKLNEMSLDEAARASNLSVSAIKALLHRALARLRSHGRSLRD